MLEKLQIVKQRFDEVSDLIIQPDIIADQKRYVQLNKEYKDLRALMDERKLYLEYTNNLEEAEEILADGSDQEMVEIACRAALVGRMVLYLPCIPTRRKGR